MNLIVEKIITNEGQGELFIKYDKELNDIKDTLIRVHNSREEYDIKFNEKKKEFQLIVEKEATITDDKEKGREINKRARQDKELKDIKDLIIRGMTDVQKKLKVQPLPKPERTGPSPTASP